MKSALIVTMTDRILRVSTAIVVNGLIARSLGPEQFGEMSLILAVCTVFQAIPLSVSGAYSFALISAYAYSDIGRRLLQLTLALSLIAAAVYIVTMHSINAPVFYLLGAGLILATVQHTLETIGQYDEKQLALSASRIAITIVFGILKSYFAFNNASLATFLLLLVAEALCNVIVFYFLVSNRVRAATTDTNLAQPPRPSELLKRLTPFAIAALVIVAYNRTDLFLIGTILGPAEAGRYAAALKLSEGISIALTAGLSLIYPRVLKRFSDKGGAYDQAICTLSASLFYISVFAFIGSAVLAYPAIELIYGVEYALPSVAISTALLNTAAVFSVVGTLNSYWLAQHDEGWLRLKRFILSLVLNAALAAALIPHYGISGAASSVLISQFCGAYMFPALSRTTRAIAVVTYRAIISPASLINRMKSF